MYIIFDIGGTKVRLAASTDLKKFGKPIIVRTPKDFKSGIDLLVKTALELSGGKRIKAVAGGAPGVFDKQKTKLLRSPNLPGWINKPLQKILQQKLKSKVWIENDAALVGLGEAVVGAGKKHDIVAYITVSTGVGGARIINKQIDRNSMGFEPGRQVIDINAKNKTLGKNISGSSLEKIYKKNPWEIKDKKVWKEVEKYLAYGLNNVLVFWSPDVIVVGGGIINSGHISLVKTGKELEEINTVYPKMPPIKKAILKDVGGLYGSLEFLKSKLK